MKRMMLIAVLALLLLGGCAQERRQLEYIGADSAKRLALEAAGVPAGEAQFTAVDMDTRNGMDYYEVCFTSEAGDWRFDIEAVTGVIIESEAPAQPADPPPEDPLVTDADTFIDSPLVTDADTFVDSQADPAATQPAGVITAEEAQAAALAHAGLSASQVTFVKTQLDWEDGRQIYEVEFYSQDNQEYDYEVDAASGRILAYDYEAESYAPPSGGESAITADRAKQLALAQVPGAAESDIREFKTDYDDGRLEYEGEIVYNGMEYEFEIDGYSGAIRKWEAESIYD